MLAALVTLVTALAVTGGATARAATMNSIAPGSVLDVVNVSATPLSRRIPGGYVGLSMEYNTVAAYEGPDREHVNPVLAQLIRNLAPGQTPILRIGGDSTDWTWWPVGAMKRPHGECPKNVSARTATANARSTTAAACTSPRPGNEAAGDATRRPLGSTS